MVAPRPGWRGRTGTASTGSLTLLRAAAASAAGNDVRTFLLHHPQAAAVEGQEVSDDA